MSLTSTPEWETREITWADACKDQTQAEWFGYPPCCDEFFTGVMLGAPTSDEHYSAEFAYGMMGTGYRPCPTCIRKPMQEVYDSICANRINPLPFPVSENKNIDVDAILRTVRHASNMSRKGLVLNQSLLDFLNHYANALPDTEQSKPAVIFALDYYLTR